MNKNQSQLKSGIVLNYINLIKQLLTSIKYFFLVRLMISENGWSWKVKFAVVMLIIAALFFASRIVVSGDPEEVISYLWKQIGFIPINIIIVAFLIDSIMSKKEHEAILEKIDMIMGTFFTKMGNDLIYVISQKNEYKHDTKDFESLRDWDDKDYKHKFIN